jgi:monoamine oxidase
MSTGSGFLFKLPWPKPRPAAPHHYRLSFMQEETIIIGAGPAGLMAACELAKSHRRALILEARDRIGGRINTLYDAAGGSIEAGAEFVHGKLPITLALLKEAKLSVTATAGAWMVVKSGEAQEDREGGDWRLLMQALKALENDMPLQDFLESHFPEAKYALLKDRAVAYAEGYDSADASRVSAKALYEEWSKEEEEQYRIDEGYQALTNFLARRAKEAGSAILLSHPVSAVTLSGRGVTVSAAGKDLNASRVIIALPLGVLQQERSPIAALAAPGYSKALLQCGFGDVIKAVLHFRDAFWEEQYPGLGFLLSGAAIPTWWTQAPDESPVFTGWMAGRNARAHAHLSDRQLLELALGSLAQIFSMDKDNLERRLAEAYIVNWSADPYTLGAYAYATVDAPEARRVLSAPLAGRVFFAGEYMYDGPAMGTVEAALWSGRETALQLLQ